MVRTVLVTGGAGFVGSAVVRRLLQDSTVGRIFVLDNLVSGRRDFLPDDARIEFIEVDICDREATLATIEAKRPTIAIHLAAIHFIPLCNRYPDRCLQTNVIGTQNVLDALESACPERLVIASSAAVYPIWEAPCSETSPLPEPTDVYGLSKWINEQQLRQFASRVETRCAAARLFNVIGPRETNPHVLPEIVDQVLAGVDNLKLGNVEPKRDYIDSIDVAEALAVMAQRNPHSFATYNVGTEREYSVRELVDNLSEVSGRTLSIEIDPARVRKSDRMHLLADCSAMRANFGWSARLGLRESLRDLWHWAKSRPGVK